MSTRERALALRDVPEEDRGWFLATMGGSLDGGSVDRGPWRAELSPHEREERRVRSEASFWKSMDLSDALRTYLEPLAATPEVARAFERYRSVRRLYVEALKIQNHVSYDVKETLERRETALRARIARRRGVFCDVAQDLNGEAAHFEGLLAVDGAEAPPVTGPQRARGPDRGPRRRRAPANAPATPTTKGAVTKRLDRNDAADARVLRLLKRHVDGLSLNAIQSKLRAGRVQVQRSLERLVRRREVQHVRIGNYSRYLVAT